MTNYYQEKVWREKSDEEIFKAASHLKDYDESVHSLIRSEAQRRLGLPDAEAPIEPSDMSSSASVQPSNENRFLLDKRHQSGSGWFGTIAVLSLINSAVVFANINISFPVGLGLSTFGAALLFHSGKSDNALLSIFGGIVFFLSFVSVVLFWLCRNQTRKGKTWAYVFGMSIYTFDALLTLYFKDWLALGFHIWGLYSIWLGYTARRGLIKLDTEQSNLPTNCPPEPMPSDA